MNELLAQLRVEREGRQRGADVPAQPRPGKPPPEAPQPEPEADAQQPENIHGGEAAEPAPVQIADGHREQRLLHLRSRRRIRRSSAGRHDQIDPRAPSLAGILGMQAGGGEPSNRAPTAHAARRMPTPEQLGFAPTLEETLSDRRIRIDQECSQQRLLKQEQRRPVRRARPTAAELGFSGDLVAVLASARPRRQLTSEHELEPEVQAEPALNEPWRDLGPRRPIRHPSAASLGFQSENLEDVLGQRASVAEEDDGAEHPDLLEDEPEPELVPTLDEPYRDLGPRRPARHPSAASLGFQSENLEDVLGQSVNVAEEESGAEQPDHGQGATAIGPNAGQEWLRQDDSAANDGSRVMLDLLHPVDSDHVNDERLTTPTSPGADIRGVPAWSRASEDDISLQLQQPQQPREAAADISMTSLPRDSHQDVGGFYTGLGSVGVSDQDRTPFPMGGTHAAVSTPIAHSDLEGPGVLAATQDEDLSATSAVGERQDPFLQAIEAASRPVDQPQPEHRQWQPRVRTTLSASGASNQDHTVFPMGAGRDGSGGADISGPARPEDHAANWEAFGRSAGAVEVIGGHRSSFDQHMPGDQARMGNTEGRGGAVHQSPHPEWVMPRRQPAARPQPRRRSSSRADGQARNEETSEAARVALASLLESSGEWTYEQLIALDDENAPRTGLSYATVRTFERRRCTEDEKSAGEACAICLEPYSDVDWLKGLPCDHCYHEDCILHWFKDNTACPMCRFDCR